MNHEQTLDYLSKHKQLPLISSNTPSVTGISANNQPGVLHRLMTAVTGANGVTGGYDPTTGSYTNETVNHPILDALFNRGNASQSAQQANDRNTQLMQQQRINEREQNRQAAIEFAKANNVPAFDPTTGEPTPAFTEWQNEVSKTKADNALAQASLTGNYLGTKDAQTDVNDAAHSAAEAQKWINQKNSIVDTAGNAVAFNEKGQPIHVTSPTMYTKTTGESFDPVTKRILPATTVSGSQNGITELPLDPALTQVGINNAASSIPSVAPTMNQSMVAWNQAANDAGVNTPSVAPAPAVPKTNPAMTPYQSGGIVGAIAPSVIGAINTATDPDNYSNVAAVLKNILLGGGNGAAAPTADQIAARRAALQLPSINP